MTKPEIERLIERLRTAGWNDRYVSGALYLEAADVLESLRQKAPDFESWLDAELPVWRTCKGTHYEPDVKEQVEFLCKCWNAASALHGEREGMVPSEKALRIARETVDEPNRRAQVKVKLAIAGMPLLADMIDEMVVLAREIIRLSDRRLDAYLS